MADLKTNYLGLELKNPIVVGASNLVIDLEYIKKAEEAGAAAIVYKSLFEEQIQLENLEMSETMNEYNDRHAEMTSLFPDVEHAGPEEHLMNLARVKQNISIPLIASLNCVNKETWVEYSKKIEEIGVDALELNFYASPKSPSIDEKTITQEQIDIVKAVMESVKIPVSVKLSPFYTNAMNLIAELNMLGVKGFVLFNKLFQPDINIETEELAFPYNLSTPDDARLPLRYAGMLYDNVKGDIIANSGIFTGKDVVKMILAGADSVQVVSTLYKNGFDQIGKMLKEIEAFMDDKGYASLDDFRGKLSRKNVKDPFAYKRAQYIDILMKSNSIFQKYSLV